METPSSTRRVTRSQTLAASNNIPISRKMEDSEKVSKSKQRTGNQPDRSALIDITNDSPIVGVAMGSLETPSSTVSKKRIVSQAKQIKTPGSGEALLRGQVKTLLQKVEEEAELSKLSMENRPFLRLRELVNSPMGLLAPTPANTPQVLSLSDQESFKNWCLASVTPSPVQEQLSISQMVAEMLVGTKDESSEAEKSLITRSLLLDFSEKSEGSDPSDCSSVLTNEVEMGEEGECKKKPTVEEDPDDASVWSIQVNASARDDEEEEEEEEEVTEEENYENYEEEEEERYDDGLLIDELCEGISRVNVHGEKKVPKFSGKHTRFIYNSDDEIEGEEDVNEVSPGIVRLNGLPTPKGKHFRFPEEEEN